MFDTKSHRNFPTYRVSQPRMKVPLLKFVYCMGRHSRKTLNKMLHSKYGNCIAPWNTTNPYKGLKHPPIPLPNGMLVFWVHWFSPDAFRAWYSRRGVCSNITSDKWSSRTLYKHLLQATTARRGEPGSRQQIPWDVRKSWSKHRSSKSGQQLGQKEKTKHKSIENNHGKIIANGKVS